MYPVIQGVEPSEIPSRMGGDLLTIEGNKLSNTTTVTIGGRNAEIVSVDEHAVQIRVPPLSAGPQALAVGVVTGRGAVTQEAAVAVASDVEDFWADETVSVSLMRYECPIEAWGTYADGEQYPYGWCGADMGYASAEAWMGSGPQPGFAAEIAGIARLSELPPAGGVRVMTAKERVHPSAPLVFNAHGAKESISIETERDFARDLYFIEERQELLEATYYWADSITEWTAPYVTLYDDEQCWLGDLDIVSGGGNELDVDGDATGATSIAIGFGIAEDYGDSVYEDWATTSSARVQADGDLIVGEASGVELQYDTVSGWFLPSGDLAAGDLPEGEYAVRTTDAAGKGRSWGRIPGPDHLDLWATWPDLTLGDAVINADEDLLIEWTPAPPSDTPTVIAVEILVYDTDVVDPNGITMVARLVARGDDAAGELVIPAADLALLPLAPNRWSEWDEQEGYWGDMTIARHQLRRAKVQQGDAIVDFIHAINGPVTLESTDP
jgi:hypothetical protein